MKPNFFTEAVISLAKFNWHSVVGEEIVWKEGFVPPSIEQIKAEAAKLEAEYNATEYQRQRAAEYPSIGDQLDALWKGGAEAEAMLAKVQAVKQKYPKGVA